MVAEDVRDEDDQVATALVKQLADVTDDFIATVQQDMPSDVDDECRMSTTNRDVRFVLAASFSLPFSPQSKVRLKRVTAMVMVISVRIVSIVAGWATSERSDPFSMMLRTMRR